MNQLRFFPYSEPNADFFITVNDSEETQRAFAAVGAARIEFGSYTAYLWNKRLNSEFISGYGVLDGEFNYGPRLRARNPTRFGLGSYIYVELKPTGFRVVPDPFAMHRVYVSNDFVTNRLHLAALLVRDIDFNAASAIFYDDSGFSYNYNTFETPVRGVRSLQHGEYLDFSGLNRRGIAVSNRNNVAELHERLSPDEYWQHIEAGAEEIAETVDAVVRSGFPVFVDVTGGRDSRIVLGGVIASGNVQNVVFNTIPDARNEILKQDLEIGTGLVREYGGSYEDRPAALAWSIQDPGLSLERRRSQVFGFNFQVKASDLQSRFQVSAMPAIRLLGGGGELYRDRWHNLKYSLEYLDRTFDRQFAKERLKIHRNSTVGRGLFERYVDLLLDTLEAMPGVTFGAKLDSHYLNFRTTTQFGVRERLPESLSGMAMAASDHLLRAASGLPPEDKGSGRVIFDVLKTLDARLPFLEFDTPLDPQIFQSRYHRVSKYDGKTLSLRRSPELAARGLAQKSFPPATRPATIERNFGELMTEEISFAMGELSHWRRDLGFLWEAGLDRYVDEVSPSDITKLSVRATKVRYISDLAHLSV